LNHVRNIFAEFIGKIPEDSLLLCVDSDPKLQAIALAASCKVEFYGKNPDSRWQLGQSHIAFTRTDFEIFRDLKKIGENFSSPLMGEHNLFNTLAVIALCHHLGISVSAMKRGLKAFKGVRRRQEIRGIKNGITVMDDFAHHPTAVRETIKAVKPFMEDGRLIVVFEPRTNTSMRNVFQDIYPKSFDGADYICIREPSLLGKIPENQRFSSEKLVADLQKSGKNARYFPDTDTIIDFLLKTARSLDTILIMSNGGFDNIHDKLLKKM
jgi:UDP-N-acetylmuramate: L-alanyl-gamma-D-glutamyl-meso-diaminopimelate ligase